MLRSAVRPAGLIAALVLMIGGCATRHPGLDAYLQSAASPQVLELRGTPFFPQQADQCGPAALATVLAASDIPVTPDELSSKVYLPERRGSLQLELLAASRRHDRLPYLLEPNLSALLAELSAGRPVLVLQNLGLPSYPVWHYAVVIGFDGPRNELILRSGDRRRLGMSVRKFMRTWGFADYWSVVILRPGEMPVAPDRSRFLQAVAALESSGRLNSAAEFYTAALSRWPEDALAQFGLANIHYQRGNPQAAEVRYRLLLAKAPDHAGARNNLAHLLAEQGCHDAALALLDQGLANPALHDPLRRHLIRTRTEIAGSRLGGTDAACANEREI